MKNVRIGVISALIGFVLSLGVSAHAEVSNLIDQVVQGMFPITVDGKPLGDAIVVDNKTYLPVREFGEAVGYAVTFTDAREVVLTKNEVTPTPVPSEQPTPSPVVDTRKQQINELRKQSDELTKKIVELAPIVNEYENLDISTSPPTMKEKDDRYYSTKKERDDLATQRDEIDKQIKALQQ